MERETTDSEKNNEFQNSLVNTLEQQTTFDGQPLVVYKGFSLPLVSFQPTMSFRQHFKPRDEDIVLASLPKSGTTWLKALVFSIANRRIYDPYDKNHPLLGKNSHELVPFFEFQVYSQEENSDLEHIQDPRIFGTHIPYNVIPDSILDDHSGCKIIYICRNPLDQFISAHHFSPRTNLLRVDNYLGPLGLDESFEMFCNGIHIFGPFWDHMLGYWNAHVKNPNKVLFLKYEDLKEDIMFYVRKIAEFIGCPFSSDEEEQGMVQQISKLCSFDKLSNLEVNKTGTKGSVRYSDFFRKGEVGDWKNYLTPEMAERVRKIMETKFEGTDLTFKFDA